MEKAFLDQLSYLILEELLPDSCVSGVFSGPDNVPIAYSRVKHIKKVHAICFSYRGCYLAKNLGKNPHYTVRKEDFEVLVRQRCADYELDLKMYASNKVMQVSDILTVFNFDQSDNCDEGTGDDTMLQSL